MIWLPEHKLYLFHPHDLIDVLKIVSRPKIDTFQSGHASYSNYWYAAGCTKGAYDNRLRGVFMFVRHVAQYYHHERYAINSMIPKMISSMISMLMNSRVYRSQLL